MFFLLENIEETSLCSRIICEKQMSPRQLRELFDARANPKCLGCANLFLWLFSSDLGILYIAIRYSVHNSAVSEVMRC